MLHTVSAFQPCSGIFSIISDIYAIYQEMEQQSKGLPHVWGEVHLAGIASHHVTFEDFLLVQSEAVLGSKDQNLVVHRLAR